MFDTGEHERRRKQAESLVRKTIFLNDQLKSQGARFRVEDEGCPPKVIRGDIATLMKKNSGQSYNKGEIILFRSQGKVKYAKVRKMRYGRRIDDVSLMVEMPSSEYIEAVPGSQVIGMIVTVEREGKSLSVRPNFLENLFDWSFKKSAPQKPLVRMTTKILSPAETVEEEAINISSSQEAALPEALLPSPAADPVKGAPLMTISVDNNTLLADGKSKCFIKVCAMDKSGKPLSGNISFSLRDENGRLKDEAGQLVNGEFTNCYTAGTDVGTQVISAVLEEAPGDPQKVSVKLIKINKLDLESDKKEFSHGDTSGIIIKASLFYSNGNPAAGEAIKFRIIEGDGTIDPIAKTSEQGGATATYQPGKHSGKVTIKGESATTPGVSRIIEFEHLSV
ncbi:MAG: Ig-like domain-containing protein [Candidatus Eremiobacteraeota bacterium]|nr:Ig-like domain-containing protein [Candidatus Eremiobacteraeota bacterium]